ncbi:glycoside hydrolase family 15 protein [Candidatus Altiarchaeota archaeon]
MTRHIALGNQSLLVNIDKWLQVRDIYYPMVGQENHLVGHAQRIGVFANGLLSWINEPSWDKSLTYKKDTLVTDNKAVSKSFGLELSLEENVYCEKDIFIRKITVKDLRGKDRKIKIFFNHDFHLYGDGIGDTAVYQSDRNVVIHYKKSRYFLTGILKGDKAAGNASDIDEYAIGQAEGEDGEGTFRDAEDGNLSKNPIAQGSVDSTIGVDVDVPAGGEQEIYYYMACGKDFRQVHDLHDMILAETPKSLLEHAEGCQRSWTSMTNVDLSKIPERHATLFKRSLLIIKTQMDKGGAITAANDSENMQFNKDTYSYVWPRDGALVAVALMNAGFADMTKPFFRFCADVLYEKGCLLHKYNPDKTLGSSWHPWTLDGKPSLPIQEDETGLVLHALNKYYDKTGDKAFIKELYPDLIKPAGEFLARYRHEDGLPKESYDLWEERRGVFTFTASAVLAGLRAAEKLGSIVRDNEFCAECVKGFDLIRQAMIEHLYDGDKGYFRRGLSFKGGKAIHDDTIDSSVYGIFEFGAFPADDPMVLSTMKHVKKRLWVDTEVGGMARYEADSYHQKSKDVEKIPGNPWFICTLWYAKWMIGASQKAEDLDEALNILDWVQDHALTTGIIGEQLHPLTGEALSVSPLTWSHAEYVDTLVRYIEKLGELKKRK